MAYFIKVSFGWTLELRKAGTQGSFSNEWYFTSSRVLYYAGERDGENLETACIHNIQLHSYIATKIATGAGDTPLSSFC